jgi:tRNA(fMet)-specific endonuclease VapC
LARLILDTTVLVDAERGGDSLENVIDDDDDVAVAAITVAELRVGVQLAKGRRQEKRKRFVAAVLDAVSVEPYDLEVANAHAELIIAATARVQQRQVVSADRSGFAGLPEVSLATAR